MCRRKNIYSSSMQEESLRILEVHSKRGDMFLNGLCFSKITRFIFQKNRGLAQLLIVIPERYKLKLLYIMWKSKLLKVLIGTGNITGFCVSTAAQGPANTLRVPLLIKNKVVLSFSVVTAAVKAFQALRSQGLKSTWITLTKQHF